MSAPPQGFGGAGGGGITPATYVGTFSGSNPTNTTSGQWWYRIDLGQVWMNVNGTPTPVQGVGAITVVSSNTTIANTDVFNTVLVLKGATLTIYGNVSFHGDVIIEGGATLLSSNPNASSSAAQTNNYYFYGRFFLNGTYTIAQYNTDNIQTNISIITTEVVENTTVSPTISGAGTLSIPSGIMLTLNINYTITSTSPQFTGSGTLAIGSGYTLTISNNVTWTLNLAGAGTINVSSGYTFTLGASITISVSTLNGSGTINISSYTLTLNTSTSIAISGSGTLSIGSGYTYTVSASTTWTLPVTGSGTLSIPSGVTLTVGANVTWSIANISGAGTLSVASGYTLTQGGNMTISISPVTVAGTWANAGYGITIPSGATVSWKTTGSLTTASTPGRLTINGTLYYYGISVSFSSSSEVALPSFPLSLAGTGIGLFTTTATSSGGHSASFNEVLGPGSNSGASATPSGIYGYIVLSSISGSMVGKYALDIYYSGVAYESAALIYIGTAGTTYSVNFTAVANVTGVTGGTAYVRNNSNSAGTLTISGTFYV